MATVLQGILSQEATAKISLFYHIITVKSQYRAQNMSKFEEKFFGCFLDPIDSVCNKNQFSNAPHTKRPHIYGTIDRKNHL